MILSSLFNDFNFCLLIKDINEVKWVKYCDNLIVFLVYNVGLNEVIDVINNVLSKNIIINYCNSKFFFKFYRM